MCSSSRGTNGPKATIWNQIFHLGADTAIRAGATISEAKRPELLWVGNYSDPLYQGEVGTLAKSLSVRLVIRVGVSDEELVDVLNRAAVMIYASRLEPFGTAPLAVKACGTPVVATAEGGVRETIMEGVNGMLVPERLDAESAVLKELTLLAEE